MTEERKYLDTLFEPVVIVNNEFDIIYYNHYFSTFSGLSPRKIKKNTNFIKLISSIDEKINLVEQLKSVVAIGDSSVSKEGLIQFIESDDVYNCVLRVKKVVESEILICFNDLSIEKSIYDKYRKQVEELKVSYKQLVLADKLKSIGELSAGISHEISNPLTIASGNTEILEILLESQENLDSGEEILESIQNIQNSLLRINKITLNMKKFVHEGVKSKRFIPILSIIESSVSLVSSSYDRLNVSLLVNVDNDQSAFVDELAIEQVLVNLLKNALDSVVSSNKPVKEVSVSLVINENSDSFTIEVKDNGTGVEEEIIDSIFNPFFTTKELGEGTGMGLSLSSQIIEDHQGNLTLSENSDRGSVFSIELPSAEISNYLDLEGRVSNLESETDSKILVIDENYENLNFFISINDEGSSSFLVSRSISKSSSLLKRVSIKKIIIGDSLFSDENVTTLLNDLSEDVHVYIYSSNNKKISIETNGNIEYPLNKTNVFKALSIGLGDDREE